MARWNTSMALLGLLLVTAAPVAAQTEVVIDVHPTTLNVGSRGKLHVTVQCTEAFDPATLDTKALALGPKKARPEMCVLEEVNGDGCVDLVCQFLRPAVGITCDTKALTLTGTLMDGMTTITGTQAIRPVPCRR